MDMIAKLWHRFLDLYVTFAYFRQVTVVNEERLPAEGSVIYLGLHRNGALDGAPYRAKLPGAKILIAAQLRKSLVGRLFFSGIEVVRAKDGGDRSGNEAALAECVAVLKGGGKLLLFPEGTSTLGPRHLPFKSGAMRILLAALAERPDVKVVPVGIRYEGATRWQRNVELVVGEWMETGLPAEGTEEEKVDILMERMEASLLAVGINVVDDEYQAMIETIAYVATLGTERGYFESLKALEKEVPAPILAAWQDLQAEREGRRLLFHQGAPLFPMGPRVLYLGLWLLLTPIILVAGLLNVLPLLAGYWLAEKMPDDRNVVSLWRAMGGCGLFLVQAPAVLLGTALMGVWWWGIVYVVISLVGMKLYYRWWKLTVAVHNGFRYPGLREKGLAFREVVLANLKKKD
ncbi:MAG TPA: 1-acyl-sn-glycerol-3-phosphate acyltransferase [Anaerolineae bacterium]|nr:1-acyl-sn-glycerol-3-phosphate acyltransferase [Anaerolineae bacterium]